MADDQLAALAVGIRLQRMWVLVWAVAGLVGSLVFGHGIPGLATIRPSPVGAIIGAVVGYAGEKPLEADWRVVKLGDGVFTGTGPFYGGAKFQIGPMALVTDEASGASAVLACRRIQAADQEMFRHVGVEPSKVPILGLKSTVHFRADFQPIAETILVVQSPGAHITDPVEMPYKQLRKGMKLRPMGPVHEG